MTDSFNLANQPMTHSTFVNRSKQDSKNQYSVRVKRTQSTEFSPWKEIKTPSTQVNCRYHHSSVVHEGRLYVYGGLDNDVGVLSDFKMFNNAEQSKDKWSDLCTENGPGRRHSHSAVIHNQTIYIFGGKVDRFNSTNQLHAYSIRQQKWELIETHAYTDTQNVSTQVKTKVQQGFKKQNSSKKQQNKSPKQLNMNKPNPIDSHQAVIVNDEMIVYGGFSNNQFTNTIYSLNLTTKIWKRVYPTKNTKQKQQSNYQNSQQYQQPQPRSDSSMVVYRNKLYIYAGKNLNKSYSDLWAFDLTTSKFTKLTSTIYNKVVQSRSGHSAIVYKNYMLIFGGITTVTHQRDDLLCYNLQTDKWQIIWNNSQSKCQMKQKMKKKYTHKKMSSTKNKSPQNSSYRSKHQSEENQKPRKYRRPIAEQKKQNRPKERSIDNEARKKQNQRKILLINEIQTQTKPWHQTPPQQYSPLIQSLTNSIMITSNVNPHGNALSARSQMNQTKTQLQNMIDRTKQKKIKARDGHTAHLVGDEMLIFGGDRHMISINDVVYINLEFIMQNLELESRNQTSEESNEKEDGIVEYQDGPNSASSRSSLKHS